MIYALGATAIIALAIIPHKAYQYGIRIHSSYGNSFYCPWSSLELIKRTNSHCVQLYDNERQRYVFLHHRPQDQEKVDALLAAQLPGGSDYPPLPDYVEEED